MKYLQFALHNGLIHPTLVLAEILAEIGLERLAILFWKAHENTRGDLPFYEKWLSQNVCNLDRCTNTNIHRPGEGCKLVY